MVDEDRARGRDRSQLRAPHAIATAPESWLTQHMQYDLCKAEKKRDLLRVKRIKAA